MEHNQTTQNYSYDSPDQVREYNQKRLPGSVVKPSLVTAIAADLDNTESLTDTRKEGDIGAGNSINEMSAPSLGRWMNENQRNIAVFGILNHSTPLGNTEKIKIAQNGRQMQQNSSYRHISSEKHILSDQHISSDQSQRSEQSQRSTNYQGSPSSSSETDDHGSKPPLDSIDQYLENILRGYNNLSPDQKNDSVSQKLNLFVEALQSLAADMSMPKAPGTFESRNTSKKTGSALYLQTAQIPKYPVIEPQPISKPVLNPQLNDRLQARNETTNASLNKDLLEKDILEKEQEYRDVQERLIELRLEIDSKKENLSRNNSSPTPISASEPQHPDQELMTINSVGPAFKETYQNLCLDDINELPLNKCRNIIKRFMLLIAVTDFEHLPQKSKELGVYFKLTAKFLDELYLKLFRCPYGKPLHFLLDYQRDVTKDLQRCLDAMADKLDTASLKARK